MKILHVIHSLDPRSGGPSAALRGLIAEQKRTEAITVLTTDAQSAEPWSEAAAYTHSISSDPAFAGATLKIVRGYGRVRPLRRFRYSPETKGWLRDLFASSAKPDVVHIHGLFSHVVMAAAQEARRAGIPYAMRPAGGLNCGAGNRWSAGKSAMMAMGTRRDLQRAAWLHATSGREASDLRRLFPESTVGTIPHGVTLPSAAELDAGRSAFSATFPHLRGMKIVLFLSRLHEKKRPDALLRAFAELREPNAHLVFTGSDAGMEKSLRALVEELKMQDRVTFAGFLTGAEKCGAFASAQVFVLPSEDENFGVAVAEAMAHGVPVLVAKGVDSHEFVSAADCGVVLPHNLDGLASNLEKMLNDDRTVKGLRGRDYAAVNLTWAASAARLRGAYDRCLTHACKE